MEAGVRPRLGRLGAPFGPPFSAAHVYGEFRLLGDGGRVPGAGNFRDFEFQTIKKPLGERLFRYHLVEVSPTK